MAQKICGRAGMPHTRTRYQCVRKQPGTVVTTSRCEAEYTAACHGVKEAVWFRGVLRDLGVSQATSEPSDMHIDNHGVLLLVQNPSTSQRTKHISVAYHFTREAVARGEVDVVPVSTEYQHADMLTKSLSSSVFKGNGASVGLAPIEWEYG